MHSLLLLTRPCVYERALISRGRRLSLQRLCWSYGHASPAIFALQSTTQLRATTGTVSVTPHWPRRHGPGIAGGGSDGVTSAAETNERGTCTACFNSHSSAEWMNSKFGPRTGMRQVRAASAVGLKSGVAIVFSKTAVTIREAHFCAFHICSNTTNRPQATSPPPAAKLTTLQGGYLNPGSVSVRRITQCDPELSIHSPWNRRTPTSVRYTYFYSNSKYLREGTLSKSVDRYLRLLSRYFTYRLVCMYTVYVQFVVHETQGKEGSRHHRSCRFLIPIENLRAVPCRAWPITRLSFACCRTLAHRTLHVLCRRT